MLGNGFSTKCVRAGRDVLRLDLAVDRLERRVRVVVEVQAHGEVVRDGRLDLEVALERVHLKTIAEPKI